MMKKTALLLCTVASFSGLASAADWKFSGNLRERYQSFNNFNFNTNVNANRSEFDSRLYLKAKGDLGHGISVLLQPQGILIQNKSQAKGAQTLSQVDFIQAYLQYNIANVGLRVGRQQLVYGDQRLLGHLGWKDVARTFDGVKGMYHKDAIKLDVFSVSPANIVAMTPSITKTRGKSLVSWRSRRLTGAYGSYTVAPKTGVDVYFINWKHDQSASVGKGRNINTYGTRLFAKQAGFDGTAEMVFQSGTWANNVTQKASAYAVKAGYTLDTWKTRLGIEYDYSPGDNKADPTTHKNFVFPFHTNHAHYGEMDFFSWANMKDLRLSIKTSPSKALTLLGNVHFLSLDKATGDWLNVVGAGSLYAGAPTYTQTKAGTEVDLKAVYKVSAIQGLKVVGLYGVFNPGAALAERNAGKANQAQFAYMIAQYAF